MYSLAAPRTVALPCLVSLGMPSMRPVRGEGVSRGRVVGVEVPLDASKGNEGNERSVSCLPVDGSMNG